MASYTVSYKQEGKRNPADRTFIAETDHEAYTIIASILNEEPGRTPVPDSIRCTTVRDVSDLPASYLLSQTETPDQLGR